MQSPHTDAARLGVAIDCNPAHLHMASSSSEQRQDTAPPPPDPVYTFRPFAGEVTCVKYAPVGEKQAILAGTSTGLLSLWDLLLKRQFWHKQFDKGVVAAESLSRNTIISQCRGGGVSLWNVETEEEEFAFQTHYGGFCKFSVLPGPFSTDPHIVLADEEFGKVNIFNCTRGIRTDTLTTREPRDRGMCLCATTFLHSHSQVHVLAGFEDGSIVLWDTRNTSQELALLKLFTDPVMCLDFDSEGSKGVCGSPLQTLEVFKLSQQDQLEKHYSIQLRNSGVADVQVRHDHKIAATGGWDGRIRVFGWKKGKPLAALNYHTATVHSISFTSPSSPTEYSNLLICGSKDQRISLWKLY